MLAAIPALRKGFVMEYGSLIRKENLKELGQDAVS